MVDIVIEFGSVSMLRCCVFSVVCVVSCRVAFFLHFLLGMPGLCGDLAVVRRILEPRDYNPVWLFLLPDP